VSADPGESPETGGTGNRLALRQIKPLDPPMVPFVVIGMIVWAILALVLLPFRSTLEAHGHGDWIGICVAGVIVAVPGLGLMIIHDRNRKRRRAGLAGPRSARTGSRRL
jgi:hypothetical protein